MQNTRQITHICPENQQNFIRSFAMDNHRSQVLVYEFYLGIVAASTNPKTRDLQRNVTGGHRCRFQFRSATEDMFVDCVAPSCRSFNLQARLSRFLASDQRYISARPRRLADMFGLALELLDGTLRRSEFLSELLEHLHNFPRRLIYTKHHAPHLLRMWSSFRCTYAPRNLITQY